MLTTKAFENENKNKKKSRAIAFFFAVTLTAIAFAPLLNSMQPDEPMYETVVTVDFRDTKFQKASKKPSAEGIKGGKETPKKVEKLPVHEVKPLPPKPPVVTTPKKENPVPTAPKKSPIPPKPTPKSTTPVSVPKQPKENLPTPAESKTNTPTETTETNKKDEPGNGNGAGNKGDGKASASSDGDDVTPGDGDEGLDFSGDGIFGRKVTYRADVKKLTQEEGKIVVNLCVDRAGRVVYAENNEELSTIKTPHLVDKTVRTAKKYRFDKDYTAATKECGKLTFIFKLD